MAATRSARGAKRDQACITSPLNLSHSRKPKLKGSSMSKPSKLAHVVYMTRRYDEMLSWYKTVFEARVQYENPAFAFLTYDDEHHRFAFANMDMLNPNGTAADPPAGVGVNHVGYTFADVGELLETYARLKDAGITPYWR